jgi:HEAT repeat protein
MEELTEQTTMRGASIWGRRYQPSGPARHRRFGISAAALGLICAAVGLACGCEPSQGGRPLRAWIQDLKDPSRDARAVAAEVIGDMGPAARAALPALQEAMKDPDPNVRCFAMTAFNEVGRTEAELVVVREVLRSDDDQRHCILLGLGRNPAAAPVLVEALKDHEPWIRSTAAQSLGSIGPEAKDAIPALTQALQDPDQTVVHFAGAALRLIREPSPTPR